MEENDESEELSEVEEKHHEINEIFKKYIFKEKKSQ